MSVCRRFVTETKAGLIGVAIRVVNAEEVVEQCEGKGNSALDLNVVLARLSCHLELPLENTKDTLNDIAELGMAEVIKLLLGLRPITLNMSLGKLKNLNDLPLVASSPFT